jgi:hypothetical protein
MKNLSVKHCCAGLKLLAGSLLLVLWLPVSQAQSVGCSEISGFTDFDVWVGEWEVFSAGSDAKAGENVIRKLEGGCMLLESWTGTGGSTGTSLNYFNPVTGEWRQV